MLETSKAFSGIAVKDIAQSRHFFGEVLGLQVDEGDMGMLVLRPTGGRPILLYPKPDHVPATYTVLNFPVDDVAATVAALTERGVEFEHYEGTPTPTDDDGVFRGRRPAHRVVHRPVRQRHVGDRGARPRRLRAGPGFSPRSRSTSRIAGTPRSWWSTHTAPASSSRWAPNRASWRR